MENLKRKYLPLLLSGAILIMSSLLVTNCKSEETGPQPVVNPPAAAVAPLTLNGNVLDAETKTGIAGATVEVYTPTGTKVTTLTSGAGGAFSYDVSQVKATSLRLTATTSGYGFSFVNTPVDTARKTTQAVSISLDKIASTTVVITSGGGTVQSPVNKESKSNQPVALVVPQGAVTQNTSLQVSSVQVNNVPAPQNAAANTLVSTASVSPANITFSVPVRLSFPLPYKFKPNDQVSLVELTNNVWQVSTLKATVDNTGYTASVDITRSNYYALLDNTKISGTVRLNKASSVLEERSFSISSGVQSIELPTVTTYTRTATNVITEIPTDEWIFNQLGQRYGAQFSSAGPGATPSTMKFNLSWPGAVANPNKLNADGSGNKNRPNELGSWSLKVTYESYQEEFVNLLLNNPGYWDVTVSGTVSKWREKSRVWVWTSHDQGTVIEY